MIPVLDTGRRGTWWHFCSDDTPVCSFLKHPFCKQLTSRFFLPFFPQLLSCFPPSLPPSFLASFLPSFLPAFLPLSLLFVFLPPTCAVLFGAPFVEALRAKLRAAENVSRFEVRGLSSRTDVLAISKARERARIGEGIACGGVFWLTWWQAIRFQRVFKLLVGLVVGFPFRAH